jgi:hypothetical protein
VALRPGGLIGGADVEPALAGVGTLATALVCGALLQARGQRGAVLGMTAALVLSPLALQPLPAALPLAFWLVAALLAAFLLLLTARGGPSLLPPLPLKGWIEAAFVLFGLALGWWVAPLAGAGRGPATALAAGAAVVFAALPLVAFSRDALWTAIGTVLLLDGAGLLAAGLTGTPGAAQVAALALAVVGVAAAYRDLLTRDARLRRSPPTELDSDNAPEDTAGRDRQAG